MYPPLLFPLLPLGLWSNPRSSAQILEEVYEFNVTYPQRNTDGGPLLSISKDQTSILQVSTKKEIKKATQQMMRTLLTLTQTLKPLPDDRIITMRLYYYDDVTPIDYQPPLFRDTVDVKLNFRKEDPVKINVGRVDTPYHTSVPFPSPPLPSPPPFLPPLSAVPSNSLNVKIQANVDSFEGEESDEAKEDKPGSEATDSEESPSMLSPKTPAKTLTQSAVTSAPAPPVKGKGTRAAPASPTKKVQDKENVQPANLSQDMGILPCFSSSPLFCVFPDLLGDRFRR